MNEGDFVLRNTLGNEPKARSSIGFKSKTLKIGSDSGWKEPARNGTEGAGRIANENGPRAISPTWAENRFRDGLPAG